MKLCIPALLLALAAPLAVGAQGLRFSPADILGWEPHRFQGTTEYTQVVDGDRTAVRARCSQATASGLFRRGKIDLTRTPILEWQWRVDGVYHGVDETRRAGDDYPARLYVVDEHRLAIWRTRALSYVWSSGMSQGSAWPNAFAPETQMVAVRSGPPAEPGQWRTQRRNVREDFRRYHGRDIRTINALAIMTDCDNAGQQATAWYGRIRFLPGRGDRGKPAGGSPLRAHHGEAPAGR